MRLIDKATGRFLERLDDRMHGELTHLSKVISQTCDSQEKTIHRIGEGMEGAAHVLKNVAALKNNLEEMVAKLEEYMGRLLDNQSRSDDSYLRISSNVEKMELVAGQQNAYLKSVSAMHSELGRAMVALQDAQKAMLNRFGEVSCESTAGLLKAVGEIRATGAQLESNRQRIGEQLRVDLTDTLDSFRDYMGEFTKRVDYLTDGIAEALNQLPPAVQDATGQFLDQIDRISASLEAGRRSLDEAARPREQ